MAGRLNQEFIRIKEKPSSHASPNMCGDRAATLCALVTRTFKKSTIVFFDTKVFLIFDFYCCFSHTPF